MHPVCWGEAADSCSMHCRLSGSTPSSLLRTGRPAAPCGGAFAPARVANIWAKPIQEHHKKVELPNIQFGPNLDVRHPKPFWVLCDIQIAPADIQFQKSGCQTSTMNFGIGCPHSLSWNWMSNSSHFKNGCQTFWMSHFDNGCQLLQKWMSFFKNGCQILQKWMSDILDVTCRKWMSDILDVTF